MQPTARSKTLLNDPRATMKLHALIADLRRRVQVLDFDLYEQEKRTGIFSVSDAAYPILARDQRARRNNLLVTITMLQRQLVEAAV